MKLLQPFLPLTCESRKGNFRISAVGREMTFGPDGLPVSILSEGHELLSGPVRLAGMEDGAPISWRKDYPKNESAAFIQKRDDREIVLCGAMASPRFIVDTCVRIEYDGCMSFDVKLMPTGQTVAQVFGLDKTDRIRYKLDALWLEVPLNPEFAQNYSHFPNSPIYCADGEVIPEADTSTSGEIPKKDISLPFKALLWIGNTQRGLGFFAENDRNWQPKDEKHVIEIVRDGDKVVLRIRLLDSHPGSWTEPFEDGSYAYAPVTFSLGLMATPVKPFPDNPYPIHGLHLDCFRKVPGDYIDFLRENNRFDRLKKKGVDTLILHEKWNKTQNWFEISEFTENQLRQIVAECHQRGIRVLVYFGYEISTMNPLWSEYAEEVLNETDSGKQTGGWYRVPFQRAYKVCYNTKWRERFLRGIERLMDACSVDGVYLDGTSRPGYCANLKHGCGWLDRNGVRHGSYPVQAVRTMFRELYEIVHARGGIINVHAYGFQNFTAMPYIDCSWYGENLQFDYCKGIYSDAPLAYFRTEYTGRNMGVPVEFIAYENRPVWNFENAVSLSIIHGILPRPNDIDGPLDLMSDIWKVFRAFPITESKWMPYWENGVQASDERIKMSYYRYEALDGHVSLLAFCANTTKERIEDVAFTIPEYLDHPHWTDALSGESMDAPFGMDPYSFRILYIS